MAEARRRKSASAPEAARKATRRVVLERVEAMVYEPDPATGEPTTGSRKEVWIERGVFEGDRMVTAIEAYVKPGTPEQRTGTFRAPPVSNWKGARRYTQPELVPVRGEALD